MSASSRTLIGLIRRPSVTVAIGLVLSGAAGSGFLAIINASYPKTAAGSSTVLALSALNFLLGTICAGVMAGAEQEMTRAVSKSIALNEDPAPVVRLHAKHAARLILWTVLATCAASPFLVRLLGHQWVLFFELLIGLVGGLAIFPIRGALSGRRDYPMFSATLFVEGITRLVPGVLLLVFGFTSAWMYGLTFALGGPTLASLFGVFIPKMFGRDRWVPAEAPADSPADGVEATAEAEESDREEKRTGVRLRMLLAATLANQFLFNAIPLLVAARYAGAHEVSQAIANKAAAVNSAAGLTRLEVMMMVPLQAPLLPPLVAAAVHHRFAEVRRRTLLLGGLCAALGVVAAAGVWVLGPWVMKNIMRAHDELPGAYLAILAAGTAFMMVGFIMQSTLLAMERHVVVLIAWITGVIVTVPVFLVGHALLRTTAIAAVIGPFTAMLIMAVDAWIHTRGADRPAPADQSDSGVADPITASR